MKKIFIMALNIALAGSMCSCSDFLDREPKNTVDPETTVDEDRGGVDGKCLLPYTPVVEYVQSTSVDTRHRCW